MVWEQNGSSCPLGFTQVHCRCWLRPRRSRSLPAATGLEPVFPVRHELSQLFPVVVAC